MIRVNLLEPQLTYESSLPVPKYIIVNLTSKGSLRCLICYPDGHDYVRARVSDCIHIRRVPIVSLAERLSR